MCTRDEYVELLEIARDALRDVLEETDHGAGFTMREAYAQINADLDLLASEDVDAVDDRARRARELLAKLQPPASAPRGQHGLHDRRDRAREWRRVPRAARESIVLDALGERRMSVSELLFHIFRTRPNCMFSDAYLRDLLTHLVESGDLGCATELPPPDPTRRRGRRARRVYFRRTPVLTGPIADLDRAFNAEESGDREASS